MRVLITGAQGQVGRALQEVAPTDVEVHALDRQDLDITHDEAVRAAIGTIRPGIILNAAAYTAVDRAEREPQACHSVNADGARFLALAALAHDARLVHVSTDYVYDGESSIPYAPDVAPHPLNAYGESKWRGEQAVLSILGERVTVLRTAWIYSAWGNNFVHKMLQLMAERGAVRVVADQVGSPTSARSVARILWHIVRRPDVHGIHHWTDSGRISWYDFAVAIAQDGSSLDLLPASVQVSPISTMEYPTPARRPRYSVLDSSRTCAALGIQPMDWRENLRQTLREIANG
jgi:dTDP-4-dehydrorhamnose reductase